jgi:integrase
LWPRHRRKYDPSGTGSPLHTVQFAPKPKLPKGREKRFEEGEEEKFFEAIGDDLEFRAIVGSALKTAMRRVEIVDLQWKNFNFEKMTVLSSDTKNEKSRTVPLFNRTLEMLNVLPRHITGRVFRNSTHPDSIPSKVIRICKTAGL